MAQTLMDAINKADVEQVMIALRDILRADWDIVGFQKKLDSASQVEGLYVNEDLGELTHEPSDWSREYLDSLTNDLDKNFSVERIELIKEIIVHIKPSPPATGNLLTKRKKTGRDITYIGIGVGGTGLIMSHTSLTVAGAVVAVGGVAIMCYERLTRRK